MEARSRFPEGRLEDYTAWSDTGVVPRANSDGFFSSRSYAKVARAAPFAGLVRAG